MDELINIANYCNSILVKYGEMVKECNAVYIRGDDIISFNMKFRHRGKEQYNTFQYQIQNYDFLITDTEVQVNKTIINTINMEIEKRLINTVIYDPV